MKIQTFLKELLEKKKEELEEILLIHVDSFYNLLYSFYNLGLLYIATLLRDQGFKVRCIASGNLFFLNYYKIKSMIAKFSPRLVGFYINSDNIHNVIHLSEELKGWLPGVRIIVGGPLATIMKEKLLDSTPFDFVVVGEGEYPLLGLAEYYLRGKGTLKDIPGIIYRQGGQVIANERSLPIQDLDELPPLDYDLIGVNYGFFYSTGRGCPFKCAFCFQEVHGKGYRFHSAERVVEDLVRNVEKYGAMTVNIVDDTFVAQPERVQKICGGLIKARKERNLDFIFFCEGRVDTFDRHPELLEELKDAGMARLQVGVESGNQKMLEAYNKKISLSQIERVIERLGKLGGISVYGNFILGGPHETEKTFEATLDFARKLLNLAPGQFECASSYLCPFPGTEIGEHPERFGLKIADQEWLKGLTMSDPSCSTEELSIQDIRDLERRFREEIHREMKRVAMRLDPSMMEKHFMWAMRYKMHTLYYLNVFSEAPILESYFAIKKSAKFKRLKDIPDMELNEWFPLRIMERRSYERGGGCLELPGYFTKVRIKKDDEIAVYEYSAGKMNIGQLAERIRSESHPSMTSDEVISTIILPLYRKLEKSYHIIFYR
jgi:anaerobic magnesium-protoporphyrin IX monomethyl ester cyclase